MPYVSPDIYPGLVPADHHNTTEVALQTHTQHNDDVHSMEHYPVEIDPLLPIPTVNISVQDDAMEGYNIYIDTKHFAFIPEKASHTAPIANE